MFTVTHYFDWEGTPAVVGNIDETNSSGYFLRKNNWSRAKPLTILEFFNAGRQLDKADFEKTFGNIGTEVPALPTS